MVWSNQAVDKITIPASVPIGGTQDGVILSGVDIPTELKTISVTAAILFQRGDFPTYGTTPEVKYYFAGLIKKVLSPIHTDVCLTIGAVVDNKDGTFTVFDNINLPAQVHTVNGTRVLQAIPQNGTVQYTDFQLGVGNHIVSSALDTFRSAARPGQTLDGAGWYNVTLNAGWTKQTLYGTGTAQGVEFKPTAAKMALLRGGVICGVASSGNSTIASIGTIDNFPTFPDKNHHFVGMWYNAGVTNSCHLILDNGGNLVVGTQLTPPTNGATVLFETVYPTFP